MSELVATTSQAPAAQNFLGASTPQGLVNHAGEIAKPLCDVIQKQKLFSTISGRQYVRVEGWQTLGNMLGILPREREVKELADGSYEAFVDLVNVATGHTVAGGSAICGTDEKRWAAADKYARRSMAITRATGKAYRLAFGWIMTMAGYEATPAEEMTIQAAATAPQETYTGTPSQQARLVDFCAANGVTDSKEIKRLEALATGQPLSTLGNFLKQHLETK